MIRLEDSLPDINILSAELTKIRCTYAAYRDAALFWVQDDNACIISMLDGDMVIYNHHSDIEELRRFISLLAPRSVFSDWNTLTQLKPEGSQRVRVMKKQCANVSVGIPSDVVSSKQLYNILNTDKLSLPQYEYFAVDICRRLNHKLAVYYALEERCAAIAFLDGEVALINGICSRQKGLGSLALSGAIQKSRCNKALACCTDDMEGFYIKNGFEFSYFAGYWSK